MSQGGGNSSSGGGGGGSVQTINGDTGSITGSSVTIFANKVANHCGKTVSFTNSGTTSTFNVTDSNTNTMIGLNAGAAIPVTTAGATALGYLAGNGSGTQSTFIGSFSGNSAGGNFNTGIGYASLSQVTTGDNNIALGDSSGQGYTTTESDNIVIGNLGTTGESNTIRIGTQGSGAGQQNVAFMAGITGVTTSTPTLATINPSGQLGDSAVTVASLAVQTTGNWTPTINGATPGTTTYGTVFGAYSKVGNMVTVYGLVQVTAATGTGNVVIGGLPFTINNNASYFPTGELILNGLGGTGWAWPVGTTQLVIEALSGTTTMLVFAQGSALTTQQFLQVSNTQATFLLNLTYFV